MTETPPPRRALATFLRRPGSERPAEASPGEPAAVTAVESGAAEEPAAAVEQASRQGDEGIATTDPQPSMTGAAVTEAEAAAGDFTSPEVPDGSEEVQVRPTNDNADLPPAAVADTTAWRAAELPVVASAAAPTFARKRARAPSQRAPLWQWAALTTLVLLLALQILLADRARLAADAAWRPTLNALCGVFGCTLPAWHEPTAFTMLDRDVRPAPNENGALRIQASFRNDARWAQAWPWLQLSLSDADGRVIGTRVFAPVEYLGHPPEGPDLLAPGQSARIDFRVREPAAGTAAFNFDFR